MKTYLDESEFIEYLTELLLTYKSSENILCGIFLYYPYAVIYALITHLDTCQYKIQSIRAIMLLLLRSVLTLSSISKPIERQKECANIVRWIMSYDKTWKPCVLYLINMCIKSPKRIIVLEELDVSTEA